MQISGQAALVTGAGSGMGEMTARELGKRGARVICVDRNRQAVVSLAESIGGLAIVCDVSKPDEVDRVFQTIRDKGLSLRVLVNCAGVAPAERIVGRQGPMALEAFTQVVAINLYGTFNMMRLAAFSMSSLPVLNEDAERGVIINTASIAAFEGQVGQAAYSAAKGGVVAMTLPAARELASFGIRVMAIAPGIIGTPMMHNMPETVQESLKSQIPFPKRMGKPEEFASLVMHIIENPLLNGEVIRLDGAIRMPVK